MEIIFWPFVSIISIGLMGNFLQFQGNIMNFILTGAITSGVLQITQLDVAYSMLYDVWSKSVKHSFLAPINHFHYILGGWFVGILRGILVFLLMLMFSRHYFGFSLPTFTVTVIFLAGVFLNGMVLGVLVCILVFFFGQKVDIAAWSFVALIMLFCGIYYPVSSLPPAAKIIAELIPLTYFLDYFRIEYGFTPVFPHALWLGFGEIIIYLVFSFYGLEWAYQKSCKSGMILRLSE